MCRPVCFAVFVSGYAVGICRCLRDHQEGIEKVPRLRSKISSVQPSGSCATFLSRMRCGRPTIFYMLNLLLRLRVLLYNYHRFHNKAPWSLESPFVTCIPYAHEAGTLTALVSRSPWSTELRTWSSPRKNSPRNAASCEESTTHYAKCIQRFQRFVGLVQPVQTFPPIGG